MTSASEAWTPVMQSNLSEHAAFICDNPDWYGSPPVAALIAAQRATCGDQPVCESN